MDDVPKVDYSHLSDEDLALLMAKYRLLKFEDYPEQFKGVATPSGVELLELVCVRLAGKQSTPA